jgi:hypothetical protein
MKFENTPESQPNMNDFYREKNFLMAKWTSEGNKDAEPSIVAGITKEVEDQKISPAEGISRIRAIDDGRIER